jgi:hypothetical protein
VTSSDARGISNEMKQFTYDYTDWRNIYGSCATFPEELVTYLTSGDALIEVRKWVNDFLRYNDMERYAEYLTYHLLDSRSIRVNADNDNFFMVYTNAYCMMKSETDRRMYVWKLLCDADLVEVCRLVVMERLEAASSEYEEILATQDLGA